MPSPSDKYVRVYYRVIDDDRFEGIYTDDRHLATWLRLLLTADAFWPASAPIPRSARPASVDVLIKAGLVELMPHDCYRIHGLDRERAMRSQSGRNGAAMRWHGDGNSDGIAIAMPRQDEQRRDKQILPSPSRRGTRNDATNPRAEGTNPRASGTSPRQERQAQKTGPTAIGAILARAAELEA